MISSLQRRGSPERGMRLLLASVIALFIAQDVFALSLSLAPGLSGKNALLYVVAAALVLKLAVQQSFVFELRALHACFAILIAYSVISMLAAAFVLDYPRYSVIASGIKLKSRLVDQAVLFLVFFHALREERNAHAVLRLLLMGVALASVITVLNALGILQTGIMGEQDNERVRGLMGEPNQDAAFGALFLPGLAAAALAATGVARLLWLLALLTTLAAVIMTASRGGFFAILLSAVWGAVLLRRYASLRRVAAMAAAAVAIVVVAVGATIPLYGSLLYERVFADSASIDLAVASSGRSEIWTSALAAMARSPFTFLTGFGWDVYSTMPFRFAPHNHYLDLWFNLGLVGLVCGSMLLWLPGREAYSAAAFAAPRYRPALLSFTIGVLAISIATFFVDLYTPWLWFWAYAGLVMRIAVNAKGHVMARMQAQRTVPARSADAYGWTARPNAGRGAAS